MIDLKEGKTFDPNKPVTVYRNLSNKRLSIKQCGYVIGYTDSIYLTDVTFHSQKSGRERCRREKQRNVHAWAKGYVNEKFNVSGYSITYNPYKYDTFVDENEEAVHKVNKLYINNNGQMIGEN